MFYTCHGRQIAVVNDLHDPQIILLAMEPNDPRGLLLYDDLR